MSDPGSQEVSPSSAEAAPGSAESVPAKQVPPGWYDDKGRQRWWDGLAWTTTFKDGAGLGGPSARKRVPLGAFWATAIGALILGLAIGGGIGAAGKATTTASVQGPVSTPDTTTTEQATSDTPLPTTPPAPTAPAVSPQYLSALSSAETYSSLMHMSKAKLYDQLTSDYGEKFSAAAAQYAVDNVKADWNANALASAKEYQSQMSMSPARIHDQLTSAYGEKFLPSEADYAIQHLND